MLFKDVLIKHETELQDEFNKLIELAFAKQSHIGDLLIWYNNGSYDESILNFKLANGTTYNPHTLGIGDIGHSEIAHYKFIHQYRQAYIYKSTFTEYQKLLEYSPERSEEINELIDFEETTINVEMLVYLKFWESDSIIKKFYELVRIINGEPYDWYFKIQESSRDTSATGARQDIIRKAIRDRLKTDFPNIYTAIKTAYKTQVRNAIAHSKYSFQQRNIHIHNFIEQDPYSQIKNITFDEWITIFHLTIVIHNAYIRISNFVADEYARLASINNNILPVRITELGGKEYELPVVFRPEFKDWHYKQP